MPLGTPSRFPGGMVTLLRGGILSDCHDRSDNSFQKRGHFVDSAWNRNTVCSIAALVFAGKSDPSFDLWPQLNGMGIMAFDILNGECPKRIVICGGISLAGLILFLSLQNVPWPFGETSSLITYSVSLLFFCVLVAAAPFDALLARLPGVRLMRDVGKISYSLYLIHFPVITAVMALIPGRSPLALWVASLPLPFLAGWVFSMVGERPFRRSPKIRPIPVDEPLGGNPQHA